MRTRAILALAVALGSAWLVAPPANAIVPCRTGDVSCYRTCYVPHVGKDGIYWNYC